MINRSSEVKFTAKKIDAGQKMIVACILCARETNHTLLQAIEETGSAPMDGEHYYEWSAEYFGRRARTRKIGTRTEQLHAKICTPAGQTIGN